MYSFPLYHVDGRWIYNTVGDVIGIDNVDDEVAYDMFYALLMNERDHLDAYQEYTSSDDEIYF